MAKKTKDFSRHFELASKKVRELGYSDLLDLDIHGTKEHKEIIRNIYSHPQPWEVRK